MIHHFTVRASTRSEAESFATHVDEWHCMFPSKPISYILNAMSVMLHGEELPEYHAGLDDPYRITFLFEDAHDMVLFKLRFNQQHGQGTS